jgi:hypothetical protein
MIEVKVNGYTYYADVRNRILYEDKEKTKGTPFNYLTKNELEQVEKELRFPRSKKKED